MYSNENEQTLYNRDSDRVWPKNGELCGTMKGNCAAKETNCVANCAANCAAVNYSFQMFWGVPNGVLIGILVYFK